MTHAALRRHPRGVAALFDAAGLGAGATAMARAVRDGGRVVSVRRLPEEAVFGRGLTAIADIWPGRAEPGQLSELGTMVGGGRLRVEVSGTYRLEGAAGAIAAMRDAHKPGKLVVMLP
jgi:NADPH:quinone reductase-like Zn-dependent oxidoreductase